MELRQLRYFVGVSEAGSLLKASARLHVAQPALGQQIAALEHELHTRLFERSSRGMALTDAGRVFLEHAQLVLADAERARLAMRDANAVPTGEVAIGLPTTAALSATLPILAACREKLPGVKLKLVEAYSGFLREWLLAGRLDFALLYDRGVDPGVARQPLLDDEILFLTGAAGRAPPKRMRVAALADWPLVLPGPEHGLRRLVDDVCAQHRVSIDVVAEIESLGSVKRAVETGIGATLLPAGAVAEELAAGRLRAAPIQSAAMSRRLVCATNATRPLTPAAAATISLVREVLRLMVSDGRWPGRWVGGS